MGLLLCERLRGELRGRALAARPLEACGLLLGERRAGSTRVHAVREARNLRRSPTEFELDPADHLRIELEARSHELEVVGVWHSHPGGGGAPSARDREAAWPGWSYLIVGLEPGSDADLRSWRLEDAELVEEALEA